MINYAPDGTCLIAIAKDLCYLAVCVNEGDDCAGITFKLANDIDLTGVDFTPIGDDTNKFNGTFDGDGTFVNCTATATVNGNDIVGGFFGWNDGTIQDCTANVTVNGNKNVGAVGGFNDGGTVENCTANVTRQKSSD